MDMQLISLYFMRVVLGLVAGLLLFFMVRKILHFFGFSTKFRWGIINYWVIKKSHQLNFEEMRTLKTIAEEYKIVAPGYLVGTLNSLDYYLRFYISSFFKREMNYWTRIKIIAKILEIRRKFALVPVATARVRNSRQFAPGTKIRLFIKNRGYFDAVIGENRYSFFTATVPNQKVADLLRKEKKIRAQVSRIGDGQYNFFTKVTFISTATKPMFMQLKQTRKLKREQLRSDIRKKTDMVCDIIPTQLTKTKKGYIFSDSHKDKFTGFVRNISSGGCAVSLRFKPKAGDFYKIRFKIFGEEMEVPGRVLRFHSLTKDSERGVAPLKFVRMPIKAKVMIQLYNYALHPNYLKSQKRLGV